ncbi:Serine/threonine-protein kinase haspin [Geranomyces michiganensis]|nr:Serine/threonine-protein kinase haspin [Geranomyces michiganensis]
MNALPGKKTIRTYGKRTHRVIGRPLQEVEDDEVIRQLAREDTKLEPPKPAGQSRRRDKPPNDRLKGRSTRRGCGPGDCREKENATLAPDVGLPSKSLGSSKAGLLAREPAKAAERQPVLVPGTPSTPSTSHCSVLLDRVPESPSRNAFSAQKPTNSGVTSLTASPSTTSTPSAPPDAVSVISSPSTALTAADPSDHSLSIESVPVSMSTPVPQKNRPQTGKLTAGLELELSPIFSGVPASDHEGEICGSNTNRDLHETWTSALQTIGSAACANTSGDRVCPPSAEPLLDVRIASALPALNADAPLQDHSPATCELDKDFYDNPESFELKRELTLNSSNYESSRVGLEPKWDVNPFDNEPLGIELSAQSSDCLKKKALNNASDLDNETARPTVDGLSGLLALASQKALVSFDDFFFGSSVEAKIGEATYSSVFSMTYAHRPSVPAALKIIPFHVTSDVDCGSEDIMLADDVVKELWVTQRVGRMEGFVELLGVGVCQGPWPQWLVDIWDAWQEPSENMHPTDMPSDQLYTLVVMPNQGKDLEHSSSFTTVQCQSIFRQLVCALAAAEEALEFEHRDLHWGNVLVRDVSCQDDDGTVSWILDGKQCKVPHYGLRMCVIDYTWSRVRERLEVTFNPLEDPGLFSGAGKGKRGGDLQFDVYRWMKAETDEHWEGFFPKTNIFWVHYLMDKILAKRMAPIPRSTSKKTRDVIKADQKAMAELCALTLRYGSCREMVKQEILTAGRWLSLPDITASVNELANDLSQLNISPRCRTTSD